LRDHGIAPAEALVDRFITRIVHELQERADELASDGGVLPGAAAALRACAALPGVHQSVLTGNVYHLAVLKLNLFRLADHVDLRIGAFGDDALDRTELVAHAWRRAEEHLGQRFTGPETIIIGDTFRDIATARRAGARAVAVATGPHRPAQLRAAGADWVLPSLANTPAVLRAIFGTTRLVMRTGRDEAIDG
jgi:phosphoglycolate phosphatase-like HAD superfamily hydrolase